MKDFWNVIQLIFSAFGGWLGYFLGGCDGLLYTLLAFTAMDYITGIMCAVNDHTLSSEVGFRGICRKVLIFMLVGIANILDADIIGTGSALRTAVIFFYISNEGVSLLENVNGNGNGNVNENENEKGNGNENEKGNGEGNENASQDGQPHPFHPPSVEEVRAYCESKGYRISPERFMDYYTANGWRLGKSEMKDWKAVVRNWERQEAKQTENVSGYCRQESGKGVKGYGRCEGADAGSEKYDGTVL